MRCWYQTGVDQWPDRPAPPPWVRQLRDETAAMLGVSAPSNHSSDELSERVEEPAHESKNNESTGGDKSSPKPD